MLEIYSVLILILAVSLILVGIYKSYYYLFLLLLYIPFFILAIIVPESESRNNSTYYTFAQNNGVDSSIRFNDFTVSGQYVLIKAPYYINENPMMVINYELNNNDLYIEVNKGETFEYYTWDSKTFKQRIIENDNK